MTDKFEALVHFLISECENPARLGATRLNKAIWFADVASFKAYGKPVTDSKYIKRQRGPVPATILACIEKLEKEGKVAVTEPQENYDPRKFISLKEPDVGCLSERDIKVARHVLDVVINYAASELSEATHDLIWEVAEFGEEIPLVATLASTQGAITDSGTEWADREISRL